MTAFLFSTASFGIRRWSYVFVWIVMLPASGWAQTDTHPDPQEIAAPEQQVEIAPAASDPAIQTRIRNILEATGWYSAISVSVDEGIVFLDGIAQTEAHRLWARDLAGKTSGTVAVVNRITLEDSDLWSFAPALTELRALAQKAVAVLPLLVLSIFVLPLAWYAARLVSRLIQLLLQGRVESPFLQSVVARSIAFPVFLLGLYVVLQVAGLTQLALSLVGGAGVLGIVIGFAFRDIAENFLSSLILSVRRPFQRGDYISVAGISGTVSSMSSRSTLLTSADGNQIHVPNATIFKNVIENFTSSATRRGEFMVGIGYDAEIATAQRIILDCIRDQETVLADPEPMVLVDELGSSTVNIRTYYWFDGHHISPIKLKSALLRSVKSALTVEGISMPDESREVIFPDGVRVIVDDAKPKAKTAAVSVQAKPKPEPAASVAERDLLSETPPQDMEGVEKPEDDLLGPT